MSLSIAPELVEGGLNCDAQGEEEPERGYEDRYNAFPSVGSKVAGKLLAHLTQGFVCAFEL